MQQAELIGDATTWMGPSDGPPLDLLRRYTEAYCAQLAYLDDAGARVLATASTDDQAPEAAAQDRVWSAVPVALWTRLAPQR